MYQICIGGLERVKTVDERDEGKTEGVHMFRHDFGPFNTIETLKATFAGCPPLKRNVGNAIGNWVLHSEGMHVFRLFKTFTIETQKPHSLVDFLGKITWKMPFTRGRCIRMTCLIAHITS